MEVFRDAILELFEQAVTSVSRSYLPFAWQELGQKFTTKARFGFQVLLNYTGGALIYIRREPLGCWSWEGSRVRYASRIRIIQNSWRSANKKAAGITDVREVMAAPKKDKEKASGEKTEEDSEGEVDLELEQMTKTHGKVPWVTASPEDHRGHDGAQFLQRYVSFQCGSDGLEQQRLDELDP